MKDNKAMEHMHVSKIKRKWVQLKLRGLTQPRDDAENRRRAKEAHGY